MVKTELGDYVEEEDFKVPSETVDGVPLFEGMSVFTSEARWGKVVEVASWYEMGKDPWHKVEYDDGDFTYFNKDRLASKNYL